MKKRYLLLIPVAACIIVCAAAIGYIQFHPERAPEGAAFLARAVQEKQDTGSGEEEQQEEPAEQPEELTAAQKRAQELVDSMTLEQKLYQMMFVTPEVLTDSTNNVVRAGDSTKESITATPVGGILYTSRNLQGKDQTSVMLNNTQQYAREAGAGIPVFTGIAEEGGSHAPAASVLGTAAVEDMSVYGQANHPEEGRDIGKTLAAAIRGVGFNMNFAPVADVVSNEANTDLQTRCFGSDAAVVSSLVSSEISGMQENGVMSAMSHFPGAGSTASDPAEGAVSTDRSQKEFRSSDLLPFAEGIKADTACIVVSNMTATAFDSVPCSLSSKVITGLLREEMGYDGIVMTGPLTDAAITGSYTTGQAAVQAVQAGADMLLCPQSMEEAYTALSEAVASGAITENQINDSVARILTAKLEYGLMQ